MNKIRLGGISSGDINGASPRVRFYSKLKYLTDEFVYVKNSIDVDLFYVQKCANNIPFIHKLIENKIPIIYDTDDGEGIRNKGNDIEVFPLVDAITTDTEARAIAFRKITTTPVYVVPDGIDYIETRPKPTEIREKIAYVFTFGSCVSVCSAKTHLALLSKHYKTTYITREKLKMLRFSKFLKWKLNNIVKTMCAKDICVLTHEEKEMATKANTRLVTVMAMGIPTIASNTASSVEAMSACGMESFIVNKPEEILEKVSLLNNIESRLYMQIRFMDYAWANHNPKDAAGKLSEVFRKVLR